MHSNEDFLPVEDHFNTLFSSLPDTLKQSYNSMRNTRAEVGFVGRELVVYRVGSDGPKVLDRARIVSFDADEEVGTWTVLQARDRNLVVGYEPVQMFDYPIFIWLPLHNKLRWSTNGTITSLAFQMVLRTQSRLHLHEKGVVYAETSVAFAKEFGSSVSA